MGVIVIIINLFILAIVMWIAIMIYNYIEGEKNTSVVNKSDSGKGDSGKGNSGKGNSGRDKSKSSEDILKQFVDKTKSVDFGETLNSPVYKAETKEVSEVKEQLKSIPKFTENKIYSDLRETDFSVPYSFSV